jgi:hypothetical protein
VKTNVELGLAIASGLLGLLAALLGVLGLAKEAAFIGGMGLVLCNVVWVMRLT